MTSPASPNDSSSVLSQAYDPLVLDLVAPLRMLSSMETSKKKCTCNHPLAIHTQAVKFAAFVVLFMALSRLLEFGLKILAQLFLSRVSLRVLMTLLCLSEDPLLVSLLFFFMLMI